MNTLLLLIIGLPILEIVLLIKIGQQVGAINTVFLIIVTAIVGLYFARREGINALRSGFINIYKNKLPIYELVSGAAIGLAAFFLIIPGFITDTFGFFLLMPVTRKFLINRLIKESKIKSTEKDDGVIEAEVVERKKEDEL